MSDGVWITTNESRAFVLFIIIMSSAECAGDSGVFQNQMVTFLFGKVDVKTGTVRLS